MARKHRQTERGRVITLEHTSRVLQDNPLGDPHVRDVQVYLPHNYDAPRQAKRRYTTLYDLVGYTGAGPSHTNWRNFEENVPDMLDRLIAEGRMPPCIVVFPDCFTSLGGNQYINSSAIGRYADYLVKEIVPFVDKELRSKAQREHRGCFGKSSGGYGAMVHGMKYPRCWGAIANHSGDAYFDFVYKAEWPAVLTFLQKYSKGDAPGPAGSAKPGYDDGRVKRFLDDVYERRQLSGNDIMALMMVCMAATYDPDPNAPLGFRLPCDLYTGEFIEARWRRWLRHDPVHMVKDHRAALKSLRGIYIDCGWRDQYHIHFGSRQLSALLKRGNIKHRYEEFDGTHSGVDFRMETSLPYLARALK